jgi:nitrite reductase/ring-hydroxylating ferredoxin subunit
VSAATTTLCLADEIAEGRALRVVVHNHPVAVFRINGRYHATDDTCTHGFASLAAGDIEGGTVICPWHGGAFDIATGAALQAPCSEALNTYLCTVRDGQVQARLGEPRNLAFPGDEGD